MTISSYPSIYNLGHAAIADLLKGPVIVEEKIDGSQFSFMKTEEGEIICRSKGAQINTVAPEKMFTKAVEVVNSFADKLIPGRTYRGEYLRSAKHNVLCYERHPKNHIILFEVEPVASHYCCPDSKRVCADLLDLECVPTLFSGELTDVQALRDLLETTSVLGGQKIEGVVIKPASYDLFGRDKKVLMGKFVSEAFKEVHSATWKTEHGAKGNRDILQLLGAQFGTPARWQKALIHLRERSEIEDSPRDIGKLMAEVAPDVLKECETEIREQLFTWAWPQLRRMITRGLPEWYKEELMKKQFEPEVAGT